MSITTHNSTMKPSLKNAAQTLGIKLTKSGDMTGAVLSGNYRVIVFCGATWRRRSVQSIRLFPCRCGKADINAVTKYAKSAAAALMIPVTVEHQKMMFTATPDGKIARTKCAPDRQA